MTSKSKSLNDISVAEHDKLVAERNKYRVGDVVNYGFNGDYYTCQVVKVSTSGHQVHVQEKEGSEIKLFTRRANGAYRSSGHGTWRLAHGAREERNPSF
jgi:hypothetical protein